MGGMACMGGLPKFGGNMRQNYITKGGVEWNDTSRLVKLGRGRDLPVLRKLLTFPHFLCTVHV